MVSETKALRYAYFQGVGTIRLEAHQEQKNLEIPLEWTDLFDAVTDTSREPDWKASVLCANRDE